MKSLLVVDDHPETLSFLDAILTTAGYSVTCANSAIDALACIDPSSPPDLLITDISLPIIDGLELGKTVRRRFKVPVLILSGMPQPDKGNWDAYSGKPIDVAEVLKIIKTLTTLPPITTH